MRQAEWRARPDLRDAFFDGYGRALTDAEEQALVCIGAVAATTTILWARAHFGSRVRAARARHVGTPAR